jgi:hypothetical protein
MVYIFIYQTKKVYQNSLVCYVLQRFITEAREKYCNDGTVPIITYLPLYNRC